MSLVEIKDGKAVTTSLLVAKKFNKRHDNVLRVIDDLVKIVPDFSGLNIEVLYRINELNNGQPVKYYELTEAGYTMLVSRFTGKESAIFMADYITEFERMRSVIEQAVSEKLIVAETQSAWAMGELESVMARQPNHKHSLACRLGLKAHEVGQYFKYLVGIGELEAKTETITRTTYHPTERSKHVTGALGKTLLFDDSVKIAFPENTDWTK